MRIGKKFAILSLMLLCISCCFNACGRHAVTEKEIFEMKEKYEDGKITYEEYLEAVSAYLNEEPLPRKGIIGAIFNFFEKVFLFVVGVAVIGFIVVVLRSKK